MAINDVSLTSGMRSNLLSLQNTVNLLDRTQTRLSTGKKVNTAIDNPTSFFAAQSLNSRASTIDSLKDAMGQAVQTITAADKGIKAITALIEQAKGIAQQALSAETSTGAATGSITLTGIDAGDTIVIGGQTFTATSAATPGNNQFTASGNNTIDAYSLADAINSANATYTDDRDFTATVVDGKVVLASTTVSTGAARNVAAGDFVLGTAGADEAEMEVVDGTSELTDLVAQYNEVRTQIDELAEDSGYKGKNLLSATEGLRTLAVKFEGATLTVEGFNATTGALGLNVTSATDGATTTWTSGATAINASVDQLDAALSTLRQESSKMSGNLSIITVRQEFSDNMINTLTEGADKLTLADANEEGANMLMLQTRQSLSTTALSLSAQAAQSVLRLFQ